MKVIFYHGFESSRKSSKYVFLEKYCTERGYKLICDEVDHLSESVVSTHIDRLSEEINKWDDEIVLVGHSLGGYYARYLSRRFGVKCLLINPCLNPENYTKNRVNASSYPLTNTVVLIDMNDGVLDMNAVYDELKDETEIIKVYGDGHKFESSLDLIAIHLDGLINSYNLPLTDMD